MAKKDEYDVIIIGAGIGGLVCGCYLAKAGLKVALFERNHMPGGCCTSFTRGGYKFDACVHFLGSLRKNGIFSQTMDYLGLKDSFRIVRHDPSDTIISKDYRFSFWKDVKKTINELSRYFPEEKESIKKFFKYVLDVEGYDFLGLRNKTFQDILNKFFADKKLKALLGFPSLGNIGVSPSKVSALKAVTLYKEFMLDGGYYIPGGVQILPDSLSKKFRELGGVMRLSSPIDKIFVKKNKAYGVSTKRKEQIAAKYIVSNADSHHTFFDLVGADNAPQTLLNTIKTLEPSLSMFAAYLGIKKSLPQFPPHTNIWYLSDYDIERLYENISCNEVNAVRWFLSYYNPEEETILCYFNVPYINRQYWKRNKSHINELLIDKLNEVIPGVRDSIIYKDSATPDTILRWTSNYKGAAYGWAGTPKQFAVCGLSQVTPIKNLFLTGHWTTLVQGVSGVMYIGSMTAKRILLHNKKI